MAQTPSQPLVWLITGCSSGFGIGLALLALQNGHHVIATSRTPSRTPHLVSQVESLGGKWHTLDVTSPEAVLKGKVDEVMSVWGRIDVLVNNAGYALLGAFECFSDAECRAQMETNFFGPLTLTRILVPYFRSRRSGTIVQISSTTGIEALASRSLYSASKFALEGFSEALYNEMAPFSVRVFLIEPGAFNSSFADKLSTHQASMPEDYKGTSIEEVIRTVEEMKGGNMRNDVEKGVRAIWDVVMREGLAEGMKEEFLRLPLGVDAAERWEVVGELRKRTWEGTRHIWESCELDAQKKQGGC
ncbi:related to short chain oxidoreductase/dehydrogenase [Phialocephala subalpina]|uniref:Related to short chain oxidoreductase/dehydrogenase n=1 Tax=Phialocephala subalpina TaxID=576137 RepID=A0A1L7WHN8_9HELO|nr:related to short chain oxidoreductase/dehydrogenase [Phialocephala subalpina]